MNRTHRIGVAYAVVASTLALAVALGGVGYAALTIPKNSVGSAQIKNNAVKTSDVKDGSLKRADFAAGQLPAAATGPAGGVLSGSYPAPGLSSTAPGVALAAVSTPGITVTPTNTVWFNRLGGAPTIVKTADASAAEYSITFPGFTADTLSKVVAVGSADGTFLMVKHAAGALIVKRGSLGAGPFSVVLYAANPTGGTAP
jgi:hypothetical protein